MEDPLVIGTLHLGYDEVHLMNYIHEEEQI
jgi:hypothetical protein